MSLRKAALMLALSAAGASLFAAPVTLDDAVAAAKESNGTIKSAQLTLSQTQRENAVNDYIPTLDLQLGASASGSIIDESFDFGSSYTVAGISWSFDSADQAGKQKTRSLSNQAASLVYQSTVNSTVSQVTTAYWNVIAARLALENDQNKLASSTKDLEIIQKKYDAGQATSLAVTEAELDKSDDEVTVQIARQTLDSSYRTLNRLTGLVFDDSTEMEDMPDVGDLKDLEELKADLESTVTMQQQTVAIAQADNEAKIAKTQNIMPSVSVTAKTTLGGGIYSYDYQDDSSTDGWFDDSNAGKFMDSTTVTATVTLPLDHLFKDSQASADIEAAGIKAQVARQDWQNAYDDLSDSVDDAVISVEEAGQNLAMLEQHLVTAQTQLELLQKSYDAGKTSWSDLSDAKDAVTDAELAIVQQKLNRTIALYDLSILLEKPLDDIEK